MNNVNRSHSTPSLNACNAFIPAVVAMPVIRKKAVLHILDGVKWRLRRRAVRAAAVRLGAQDALFRHRPGGARPHRLGGDRRQTRVRGDEEALFEATPDKFSTFVHRQPEHVEIAGALGLGEWDRSKIDLRKVQI